MVAGGCFFYLLLVLGGAEAPSCFTVMGNASGCEFFIFINIFYARCRWIIWSRSFSALLTLPLESCHASVTTPTLPFKLAVFYFLYIYFFLSMDGRWTPHFKQDM